MSNKSTEPITPETLEDISIAPVVHNETAQVVTPKNMVSDPGWFDGDKTKIEDWWRRIYLCYKTSV